MSAGGDEPASTGNRRQRRSAAARPGSKRAAPASPAIPQTKATQPKPAKQVPRLRILHLHSTFDRGGKEARSVRLMNHWGSKLDHGIVSAQPRALAALAGIDSKVPHRIIEDFPPLAGGLSMGRYHRLARAMKGFDLVLTYNWGAMDAVLAHTLHSRRMELPPLIHHEDGFNQDEAQGLKWSRNLFRSLALSRAGALVVPSQRLETIALTKWKQSREKLVRIANGIPVANYHAKPPADAIPGVIKRPGEYWVGTLAGLRAVKNLPRLVRAFAGLPEYWQLVILGEGPEEAAIRAEATRLGIDHRLHLPGFVAEPAMAVGLFDIFALSSDSEQFPLSVVEAMAAGLPVVSPDVGDVRQIVAPQGHRFITPLGDDDALAGALATLASDEALRSSLGEANRAKAVASYDEARMLDEYAALYGRVLGKSSFPRAE